MRGRTVSKGDIVSEGAETEQGWGTIGHPGVDRAFRGEKEEGAGLPVKTEAADSREVIGDLGDSGRGHGSSKNRSIPGWGQTGQDGVRRHRWVPSRHHIPPTVIHLEEGSRVALAPPWSPCQSFEGRRAEKKGSAGNRAGYHQEGSGGLQVLDSRGISQQGGCSGSSLQTHHSHVALRPRDWRGKGPQWTWCTVCPNRSAPGSGMTDRTFPGESRTQDEARQGEAGGAEWVSFLGREVGGVGRARQSNWGGEPVRHWPPESVAKEGLAGGDGAVIGASESSNWRLG